MDCYIDTLPPEILSEILLHVLDSLTDDISLQWRLPLLLRQVSKRFRHITMNTCALWRYLYIRHPLHPNHNDHVTQSGSLSLEAHAKYIRGITQKAEVEMANLITQVSQRLATLTLASYQDDKPITRILDQTFPVLERLDVIGSGHFRNSTLPATDLPASRFPSLRSVLSVNFHSGCNFNLPDTVEDLDIIYDPPGRYSGYGPYEAHFPNFWSYLPKNLCVLRIEGVFWTGVVPSLKKQIHLPCLIELSAMEDCEENTLSILQCLVAPCLEYLSMRSSNNPGAGVELMDWYLDFPNLTHMEWQSWPNRPQMEMVHQLCTSLKSLHIKPIMHSPPWVNASISRFVTILADDQTLLPLLEDIAIRGASIDSLRSLAYSRTRLTCLKVFTHDLGPEFYARPDGYLGWDGYSDWQEYETWLGNQGTTD